jgi:pyruvyltransferase
MTNRLRHCKGTNFGDGSNPWLFKHYMPNVASADAWNTKDKSYKDKTILGMGSIMGHMSVNDIVCGSGMINDKSFPKWGPGRVKEMEMVRGPLTYDLLTKQGYKVKKVFADPGLLFSDAYKAKSSKKYDIGIIPHFVDKKLPNVEKLLDSGVKFIDVQQAEGNEEKFLDEVNECNIILSSSLHGVIIGDSYNIPSYHIKLSDKLIGGDFKFKDYYYSVGREYSYLDATGEDFNRQMLDKYIYSYKCEYDLELIKNTVINVGKM